MEILKTKLKYILLGFSILISGTVLFGQTARVIGYLPTYRFSSSSYIEYCKLTHLNLAFANPDSAGNFNMPGIAAVMSDAKSNNPDIIVCISMGGGGMNLQQAEDWSNLIDIPSNRPAFITKIVDYVLTNNLDGVDVDLEWGHVTSGYSGFVTELDTALNAHNKILTVAFPNQTKFSHVSQAALDAFDFINIMSYDATGPWSPSSPGQHSSYSFSTNGINFWKNSIGIPGDKLNLGVPFYGYDFVNSSIVNAVTFGSMVDSDASYADKDNVGSAYYNGRPTIREKVNLAAKETGGIMIWELGQDSFDEYSLLNTIHEEYTNLRVFTTGLCGNDTTVAISGPEAQNGCRIYPNPASAYFILRHDLDSHPDVIITNITGQIICAEARPVNKHELRLELGNLRSGIYFVTISNAEQYLTTQKLLVK